jgi:hypothetical protein
MKALRASRWAGVLLAIASFPAWAGLGGGVDSVESDRVRMKASARVLAASTVAYTVQEVQTAAGTTLREYVSSGGIVFGVAWSGPRLPDLPQVLAGYYPAYAQAAQHKAGVQRPFHVVSSGLVFHSAGHMRAFSGFAYVPQLLPAGVTADDIR